jgi:hypothetical protein
MYIFWVFKVLKFHIFRIVNIFLVCIIGYCHLIFLIVNSFLLYESFESPLWKDLFLMIEIFIFKNL